MKIKLIIFILSIVVAIFSVSIEYAAWEDKLTVGVKIYPNEEPITEPQTITDTMPEMSEISTSNTIYENSISNSVYKDTTFNFVY